MQQEVMNQRDDLGLKPRRFARRQRDPELCYRRIALEESWADIAKTFSTSTQSIKRRFEQLAEEPAYVQQLVAEYAIQLTRQGEATIPTQEDEETLEVQIVAEEDDLEREAEERMLSRVASAGKQSELTQRIVTAALGDDVTPNQEELEDTNYTVEEEDAPVAVNTPAQQVFNPHDPVHHGINSNMFGRHSVTDYNRDLVDPVRDAVSAYARFIGPVSIQIREALYETMIMVRERALPVEWVKEAVITVSKKTATKRTLGYIIGLVRNWCIHGRGTLDTKEENTVIDFVRGELGYLFNKEVEQEVIKSIGLYGPVETMVKFHGVLKDFDISRQITSAFKKNIETSNPSQTIPPGNAAR